MDEYRPNRQPLVAPGEIDHHVGDMTATIAADMPLARVQQTLMAEGQWLPIDGDPSLPVGELVATNSSGPLRLGYGHWRDLLLGAQFTNGLGDLITAGGRTVKNVAGYDLTKFLVGQRGVFGTLVTLTTRTYKLPAGAILAAFAPRQKLINALLPSPQRPQWAMLTSEALLCGYVGDERALAFYASTLPDLKPRSIEKRPLQADIEHRASLWRGDFRAAVAPSKIDAFVNAVKPSAWVADAAFGIVLGRADNATQVREAAKALGGVVSFASDAAWFDVPAGPQRALLERLKLSFDPDNRLAPLPWQHQQTA
jgi:hypothetical protein